MKKLLLIFTILALLIGIIFGKTILWPFVDDLQSSSLLYQIRIPHVLLAFFSGAALSLSGSIYQGLFKNNLASPYTLGVASGASLGAFLAEILSFPYPFLFSLIGALLTIFLVFVIPNLKKSSFSLNKFLLTGVCLSFIFSSLILFAQFSVSSFGLRNVMHFLLGDISIVGWDFIYILIPSSFTVLLLLLFYSKELSLIEVGETHALVQGVNVKKVQYITLIVSSVLVSIVISFCGPIGFVGIIIPNIFRKYFSGNYKEILPQSFMGGGIFLVLIDLISRIMIHEGNFPVGILTSLIGGPLFLIMLLKSNQI